MSENYFDLKTVLLYSSLDCSIMYIVGCHKFVYVSSSAGMHVYIYILIVFIQWYKAPQKCVGKNISPHR